VCFAIHQVLSVATAVDSMLLQLSILAGGGGSSEEQARATARQLAPLYVDLTTVFPPSRSLPVPRLASSSCCLRCTCVRVVMCVFVCMCEHARVCGSGL
jgi:hypothetical protein